MITSLNERTLEETFTLCGRHTGYEAVIVLPVMIEVYRFTDELINAHRFKAIPSLRDILRNHNNSLIRFINGSSIKIATPNSVRRGDRYHTILVSDDVNNKTFLERVYLIEKSYEAPMFSIPIDKLMWRQEYTCDWIKAEVKMDDPMENVTDTKELDDFLKGFKIASKK